MPRLTGDDALLRVGKATKAALARYREVDHLKQATGLSVEEMRHRATADRWRMAYKCGLRGDVLLLGRPTLFRDAISRHYYAMYHSVRAVVFFAFEGR